MRTLYFDCFAGASGDMILGALVDCGLNPEDLLKELERLNLSGYSISFEKVNRSGISSTKAHVKVAEEHRHRHLKNILKIIDESGLSETVKHRSSAIFTRLAQAEAKVHNQPIEKVHFHEVGAMDAIIDVVGCSIGFEMLNIERFICSDLHVGSGWVEMEHGRFPVPPPAVAELLKGFPVYSTDIQGELMTPTGAAIISTLSEYQKLPQLTVEQIGHGAGTREYKSFPNVCRILIGTRAVSSSERLTMVETNVDDMSPQLIGHCMDLLLEAGALDCFFTPVLMKKNRPATLISVLCRNETREKIVQLLMNETTTLGVRHYEVERTTLPREIVKVDTPFGAIDIKVANSGGVLKFMPEYDQCREAAIRNNVPLREVEEAAREAFRNR
jgi:pyridinium-3,5-bisthiocarboxylic acid mononucleotide nickel chelatase